MHASWDFDRVAVVGTGSAGRRHVTTLRALLPDATIVVQRRPDSIRPIGLLADMVDDIVSSLDDVLAFRPQLAVVAGPAPLHVPVATALGDAGAHLLVEKPLSDRADHARQLTSACRDAGVVLMVGYHLRYGTVVPSLVASVAKGAIGEPLLVHALVGQYLPDWRPDVDYRRTVSARASLGGGVLLELSHELDSVMWLAGPVTAVSATVGRVGPLDIDVEDSADLVLTFAGGAVANLHLDMLRRPPRRECTVIGTSGTLEADLVAGRVRRFDADAQAWTDVVEAGPQERDLAERRMMRHFLDCAAQRAEPLTSGEAGWRVLEVVEAARISAAEGRRVVL